LKKVLVEDDIVITMMRDSHVLGFATLTIAEGYLRRVTEKGDVLHINLICCSTLFRGNGRKMMEYIEMIAENLNIVKITLSAIPGVVGFYRKQEYTTDHRKIHGRLSRIFNTELLGDNCHDMVKYLSKEDASIESYGDEIVPWEDFHEETIITQSHAGSTSRQRSRQRSKPKSKSKPTKTIPRTIPSKKR
jgi:hypothetical protein